MPKYRVWRRLDAFLDASAAGGAVKLRSECRCSVSGISRFWFSSGCVVGFGQARGHMFFVYKIFIFKTKNLKM